MTAFRISATLARITFWSFLIFITYKFLAPGIDSGINIPHLDKLAHFVIFALLAGLVHFSYKLNTQLQLFIWAIYGVGIELLQGLTPTRSPEILDFVADMLGVIVTLLILPKIPLATEHSEKADD